MNKNFHEKTAIECLEEWLDSYLNFEKLPQKDIFWLDTIDFLCKRFNDPQKSYSSVHIAGSKGKGSTSTLLCSIIEEYLKTTTNAKASKKPALCGLYTSPHILSLQERIGTAHSALNESTYEKSLKDMVARVESIIPEDLHNSREITWFELITLYAFLCFREQNLPWAVFETGLGGRLDATNILIPELSVITPIELEHTEFLGDTIEKIAFEKAGIIKPSVPVCVSVQKPEAKTVFVNKALETGSPIYFLEDYLHDYKFSLPKADDLQKSCKMGIELTFNKLFARPIKTEIHLIGEIQVQNAALASLCAKILFPKIDESVIEAGLSKAYMQGRFEIVQNPLNKNVFVVLDGAHTVNSILGTLDSFKKIFSKNFGTDSNKKAALLYASAKDKDVEAISSLLINSNLFDFATLTKPGDVKQSDLPKLEQEFTKFAHKKDLSFVAENDFSAAIKNAIQKAADENKTLLVTGSFYLLAEVKKAFFRLGL